MYKIPKEEKNLFICSISGISSSGKSTLFKKLKDYFESDEDIVFFSEGIRKILNKEQFHEMLKEKEFVNLQILILSHELKILSQICLEYKNKIIILDRCLFDVALYCKVYKEKRRRL